MPSVAVTFAPAARRHKPKHRRATLTCGHASLTLPSTAPSSPTSDVGSEWTQIPRPGDTPLLRKGGKRLRQMQLTVIFAEELGVSNIESKLEKLERFSDSDEPVHVAYGPWETGRWRLLPFTVNPVERVQGSNAHRRTDVSLTFVEVIAGDSGGVTATSKGTTTKPSSSPKKSSKDRHRQRTYVVRKGDTLSAIAQRFYHDANLWPKIAKANDIRRPRKLKPGTRLIIP